jgi:two-component system, sensor histidine kinase and response regulator
MMTTYEYGSLLLQPTEKKEGGYFPERPASPEISEEAIRNELKALRRSNNRLREQLAALETRNIELDAYAHTVAHNLKNPLAVITMTADAISDIHDLTPRELNDFLRQIQGTAHEMDDIVDNLLLFSEVRKADAPIQPVDMTEVMTHIRKRLAALIKGRRARIRFPKTWPDALGYAPWVEEVWSNYLSNALKYGGDPPCIELGAGVQPDGMVRYWLRDHGPGLTPEARMRMFTSFPRIAQAHRGGHGLGLLIVRSIVEKLGGEVGVESEPGNGSLFFFTLRACRQTSGFRSSARRQASPGFIHAGEEVG